MTFSGRVALITGGTGDLGRPLVRCLAQAGLCVAFTYHTQQDLAESLIKECGPEKTQGFRLADPNPAQAKEIAQAIQARWGPVNYLVNNLGVAQDHAFLNLTEEDWKTVLHLNIGAAFAFCQAILFPCIKQGQGAIVNVSSVSALTGSVGQANYATAKAGLLGLTRALAREVGHFGVRINAVAPGYIRSRLTESLPDRVKTQALQWIPMQRFGQPEEVAAAIAFLLSDEAAYIHGQVLVVDGGLAM